MMDPKTDAAQARAAAAPRAIRRPAGSRTRVAIVGCGFIADFHLDVLAELTDVEVVATCDPALDRARALAGRYGIEHAVGSLAELAELEVDVAHLLVPPDLHVALTRELLELGIGAFVEKPLALGAAEAAELAALADERGLVLAVNHNNRFHPAFERLLERVRAGHIGRVEHVQVTLSVPLMQLDAGDYGHWMFRAPRNIVFEQAVHPLCQVHALVGRIRDSHTHVLGTRELAPGQTFHDRWLFSARGERGTAEVYLAFGQGFTRSTIQVLGSDGSLECDLFHNHLAGERKTLWLDFWNSFLAGWRRGKSLRRDARRVLSNYLKFTLGLGRREDAFFVGMRRSIEAFHRELRAGEPIGVDAAQAAEVLAWCDACAGDASGEASTASLPYSTDEARPGEVVVLGGTGFIGRRLVADLRERGLPVTCAVRRTHSLPPVIAEGAEEAGEDRIRLVPARLEDADALRAAVRGAKTVLHLATGGGDTWEAVERSMIGGSVALAEACLAEGVERFVYVSSIAALYTAADGGNGPLEDSLQTDPVPGARDLYARGKIATEAALVALARERGLPLVIARPGVVVGEGTPMQHSGYGLWARDNHCVGWGAGEHPLPLVLADDVAEALCRIAAHGTDELHGKALNLCANVPLTAREVVEELRRVTGRDLHFHPRSLVLSQTLEIGKWAVKVAGRRPGVTFPSWRDLKSRALSRPFTSRTAREVLGWKPVEEREAFLDAAVRIYAPEASS